MANVLLPPQVFNRNEFIFSPNPNDHFRKLIFQCEVRMVHPNGDVEMGLIGYPAWKRGNAPRERWNIGTKVHGTKLRNADPGNPNETVPIDPDDPLALGNNESPVWRYIPHPIENVAKQDDVLHQLNKIFSDGDDLTKITFEMNPRLYKKNLHAIYDVTFSDGTTTTTNPCPPNQPGE